MLSLNIFTDFCNYWWLAWLLPFILGLLLGYAIWAKYARRARELEDDLASCRNIRNGLEKDIKKLKNENSDLESESRDLKRKLKSSQSNLSSMAAPIAATGAATGATGAAASSNYGSEKSKESDKFSTIKNSNLQLFEGIGPVLESVLHENGITDWSRLSSKSKSELQAVLDLHGNKFKMIDPSDWQPQAKLAIAGDWEGLMKFQKADGSASKAEKFFLSKGWI